MTSVKGKNKLILLFMALIIALTSVYVVGDASVVDANSAFDQINLNGDKVGSGKNVKDGVFKDLNAIMVVFLGIAGFIILACLIFAGVRLATAQNNPQNRTQGFIGLGMALLGGWIVYKALDIAGWIKGFGG